MQYHLYTHKTSFTKRLLKWLPEVYFITVALWWTIGTYLGQKSIDNSVLINYPALILMVTLIVQFFIKNKHLGIALAALITLGNFFLILALASEAFKVPAFDQRIINFLIYGGLFIALNLLMAYRLFHKYSKMPSRNESNDIPLGI